MHDSNKKAACRPMEQPPAIPPPADESWMRRALDEAQKAGQTGEVPIGAVLVDAAGEMLASARNRTIGLADPTAHAEMLALRAAARKMGNYRLLHTTLYVTIEPCVMCMGALIHARVARIVFGARDPHWGAAGSLYDFAADTRFNHRPEMVEGVLAEPCRRLIQAFFRARRKS
jgi:tRNA(adenine34) deaminase